MRLLKMVLASSLLFFLILQPLQANGVKNPDTLVIDATEDEPNKLEPASEYEVIGGWILQNTYETAWFYDSEMVDSWSPTLADGLPSLSQDGLNVTFTLKPNIYSVSYEPEAVGADAQGFKKWGPLTAEDVKYSFDRTVIIGDPTGPAWMYEFVRGARDYMFGDKYGTQEGVNVYLAAEGVTVDGPWTVSVHLTEPAFHAYQAYVMMQPWYAIYSQECVEAHGGLQPGVENDWLMTHTCGTGPYVVTEWTPEDRIVMKANPYWRDYVAGSYPALTTILMEFEPEVYVRVDELKLGDADFGTIGPTNINEFVNTFAKPPFSTFAGVAVYPSPTMQVLHLSLQMNTTRRPDAPFVDPVVRRAFQHIVDKKSIISTIMKGLGTPADGPIVEGVACFEQAKADTTYSLNSTIARQMLLDAGYSSQNPINAVFLYPSGFTSNGVTAIYVKAAAEQLLDNEGKQFIFIDILGQPFQVYVDTVSQGTQYDMYVSGWQADFPDPDNFIYPYLHSKGLFSSSIGFNDTQIDQWIEQAKLQSRPAACSLYQQIQERGAQLSPHIYLFQPIALYEQRDWIQGFYPYSTNPMQYGYGFVWKMSKASSVTTTTTTTTTTTSTTTTVPTTTSTSTTLPTTTTVPSGGVDPALTAAIVVIVILVAVIVVLFRRR